MNSTRDSREKYVEAFSDNVIIGKLGRICREAGAQNRTDVGDDIDRGLILLRLLHEQGFRVKAGPAPQGVWTSRPDFDPTTGDL